MVPMPSCKIQEDFVNKFRVCVCVCVSVGVCLCVYACVCVCDGSNAQL